MADIEEYNENDSDVVMYILVNNDLGMGKGKIAGQVGHVVGMIVEEIIMKYIEKNSSQKKSSQDKKLSDSYTRYLKWKKTGHTKIILKATEEQIKSFIGEPESAYVLDMGKTQIAPDSLTVIGFYPSDKLKNKFKNYKLL